MVVLDYDLIKVFTSKQFGDINQLVMLALLELIDAKKDKANRSQSFQQSYELALLAHHFDKSNSSVLNLLANYKFHSWHKLSEETTWELQSMDTIRFGGQLSDRMLGVGDHLRLTIAIQDTEHATLHIIIGANEISVGGVKYLDIQFNPKFQDLDDRYKIRYVECKDFRSVSDFAHKALRNTNNNAIKADSYYILGKLAHTQKNLQLAYDCYQKATELVPDMILANYGAAQIYFAKKEFSKALDLFEKIHHLPRGADDKDTICYISLLKALSRGEYDNFEKLKEIAPGFQFQYDLWLAQGQARFKKPAEYLNAVKCLLEAKRALSEKHIEIPTNLLLNISTLYFNLKDYSNALSYIQLSLTSSPASKTFISSEVNNTGSEIYKLSDFEGVFYEWSEVHIAIKQDENDLNRFQILDSTILPFEIYIGAEILIEDSIWKITQVFSPTEFECCNTFNISISFENYIDLKFRPKVYFSTFSSNNVVTIFNYGRLLEETNMLNAAVCIFENILILHPSHAECKSAIYFIFYSSFVTYSSCIIYLGCFRLSFIQRACGKFEIAKKYLHKMIAIGEDSVDVHVALGEINVETGALDLAKSNFENAYAKVSFADYNFDGIALFCNHVLTVIES